jgi:hypothetical protein
LLASGHQPNNQTFCLLVDSTQELISTTLVLMSEIVFSIEALHAKEKESC